MAQMFTRAGCIKILVITAVGLAVLPFTPGFQQRRNMRRAEEHEKALRPILGADRRFERIKFKIHTGSGGSLIIHGAVANSQDVEDLKKLVTASNPPIDVIYAVDLAAEPTPFPTFPIQKSETPTHEQQRDE